MTDLLPGVTAGTYRVDVQRSTIDLRVRHMFGLGTVHGRMPLIDGTLHVTTNLDGSTARATVDAGSFTSGNRRRDADVTGRRLLDAARWPTIAFTGGPARRDPGTQGWRVTGQLTVRGTTSPITVPVTLVETAPGMLVMTAATTLDRTQHGLARLRGIVGRTVHVSLHVVALHTSPDLPAQ